MFDLVLENLVLDGDRRARLGIAAGRIAAIAGEGETLGDAAERMDLGGALVLPGFVDGHIHLDTTLFGDRWQPHRRCRAGFDVAERIAIQKEAVAAATPLAERAEALLERAVSRGTTRLRTHVEIDVDLGLTHFEGICALRERYRDHVSIEIAAFPRGVIRRPGTAELLEESLRQGADVVGGVDPSGYEGDIAGHLDAIFGLAEKYARPVDIHLHDGGSLGLYEIREIAGRTRALGMQGKVAVSHAYALGDLPWDMVAPTADSLAEAGISIMTNAPGDHPFPPVLALRGAGVNVFAGNDDIRDSWWPYGDGDMLERAMIIGYRSGFYTDEELRTAFELISEAPARALSVADYGIAVGNPADLVAVDAAHVPQAVVARPAREVVFKAGRPVARHNEFIR
ncbi:MAG: amidohydrolase family protein [Flavobacteriaceae bacterium]